VRSNPDDIGRLYVRSWMAISSSTVVQMERITYPPVVTHYNVSPVDQNPRSSSAGLQYRTSNKSDGRAKEVLQPDLTTPGLGLLPGAIPRCRADHFGLALSSWLCVAAQQ